MLDYQALKNLKLEARLNFSYTNNYRVKSQSHRFLGSSDGTIGGFARGYPEWGTMVTGLR